MSQAADLDGTLQFDIDILRLNELGRRHSGQGYLAGTNYKVIDDKSAGYIFFKPANPEQDSRTIAGRESPNLEQALRRFTENEVKLELPENFFEEFGLQKKKFPHDRYGIAAVSGEGRQDHGILREGQRWLDGAYTFVLTYDANPVTVASFGSEKGAICVKQIQGIPGHVDELSKISWPNALIEIVTHWAAENGVSEARVLPQYLVSGRIKNGELKYDKPAQERGFRWDEDMKRYRKRIEPASSIQPFYDDFIMIEQAEPLVITKGCLLT